MSEILNQTLDAKNQNNSPEPVKNSLEYFKGKLCSLLVPGDFLLGTQLLEWYESNEYHRFNTSDILILKAENIVEYEKRPVVVVKGYIMEEEISGMRIGKYVVEMIYDVKRPRFLSPDSDSDSREFKLISIPKIRLESLFQKIKAKNADDALRFY